MNGKLPPAFFDPDSCLLDENADDVLLALLARDNEPPPFPRRCRPRVPSPVVEVASDGFVFDRAEFLRHMRGLVARREEEARKWREFHEDYARNLHKRERKALDCIMRNEELGGAFDPPPPPKPPPALPPPRPGDTLVWPSTADLLAAYRERQRQAQQHTPVEPWFDPTHTPSAKDLQEIETYALGYLAAAMRVSNPGRRPVKPTVHVECDRDADAIAGTLYRLATGFRGQSLIGLCVAAVADGALVQIGIEFRA